MDYQLITDAATLQTYLAEISPQHLLAIDTEFFRETTYYPELGLIQLAYDDKVACVDPLAFDVRPLLLPVLTDPQITKLFHSCSQDLEVILYYFGDLPCPLFDTQVAAALVMDRDQISYAALVAETLGVELAKSQTRTNWLKRPLSREQLKYAAEDVYYLQAVYDTLQTQLEQHHRGPWFEYECRRLCRSGDRFMPDYDHVWLRVKGTHRMQGSALAVVDALARWREDMAIALNITRRQVMSDDCITAAALQPPDSTRQLAAHGKLHRRLQAADLEQALQAMQQALRASPDSWPTHPHFHHDAEQKSLIRNLMQTMEHRAHELGIAQAVLGSRKEIEKLVNGERQLDILDGWRADVIGNELLAQLQVD